MAAPTVQRPTIAAEALLRALADHGADYFFCKTGTDFPQNQKALPKHELVIPLPFVHSATEYALVVVGGSLQIADVHRDVIDRVSLESRRRRRARAGCQQSQSFH